MIIIAVTIILIVLVALNIIKHRFYAVVIYLIGLGSLYSNTLPGLSVVGSDVSRELLMSNLAIKNGWDLSMLDPSNTSFIVGLLVPMLSFNVAPEWIYKIILPMIFACTPVLLYFIFRKQIDEPKAFYASLFFIFMPVFSLEISTIGKSMVAETLMVLCLWVLFSKRSALNKSVSILILAILTVWAHYTVGILLIMYLAIVFGVLLVRKLVKYLPWRWFKFYFSRKLTPTWVLVPVLILSSVFFYAYFTNVSQGSIWKAITRTSQGEIFKAHTQQELDDLTKSGSLRTTNTDPLLKLGLAKDFTDSSPLGKVFRTIQYITQGLIIAGCLRLLIYFRKYNFSTEFLACICGSLAILLCCIFIPSFASIINMTRWYHTALFFLAPMFVLGFDWHEKVSVS